MRGKYHERVVGVRLRTPVYNWLVEHAKRWGLSVPHAIMEIVEVKFAEANERTRHDGN